MLKFNRDCCDAVAGNTRAGKFLHQLVFWLNSPKAPVFDGHRCVAFTRQQWAEKTGLTVDQIRRILLSLAAAKLILCEQHKWGGKVPNFIRLTPKCFEALCAAQVAQKCATQVAQNCATLFKPKDINEGDKKVANGSAVATSDKVCIQQVSGYQNEVGNMIAFPIGQGGPDMQKTVAEIMAEQAQKWSKAKPIDTLKPDKVASLEFVWRTERAARGLTSHSVTMKMRGQFKHLIECLPPGTAPKWLTRVVRQWGDFVYEAEKNHGAYKTPDEPSLDFLIKYMDAGSKLKDPVVKAVQSIAQTAPVVIKPPKHVKEKPATMDEILAIEAEFAKGAA